MGVIIFLIHLTQTKQNVKVKNCNTYIVKKSFHGLQSTKVNLEWTQTYSYVSKKSKFSQKKLGLGNI